MLSVMWWCCYLIEREHIRVKPGAFTLVTLDAVGNIVHNHPTGKNKVSCVCAIDLDQSRLTNWEPYISAKIITMTNHLHSSLCGHLGIQARNAHVDHAHHSSEGVEWWSNCGCFSCLTLCSWITIIRVKERKNESSLSDCWLDYAVLFPAIRNVSNGVVLRGAFFFFSLGGSGSVKGTGWFVFKDWTIEEGDKRVGTRNGREHKMAALCLSVLHVAPFSW